MTRQRKASIITIRHRLTSLQSTDMKNSFGLWKEKPMIYSFAFNRCLGLYAQLQKVNIKTAVQVLTWGEQMSMTMEPKAINEIPT